MGADGIVGKGLFCPYCKATLTTTPEEERLHEAEVYVYSCGTIIDEFFDGCTESNISEGCQQRAAFFAGHLMKKD